MSESVGGFVVIHRNIGHWDICRKDGRLFRIRGGPGSYVIFDERKEDNKGTHEFKTVSMCMSYICDELMFELIVAKGQVPEVIEAWNILEK